MRFPYRTLITQQPVHSLGGAKARYLPIVPLGIGDPHNSILRDGLVDSAADDTILPESIARRLGIGLTQAVVGHGKPVGGASIPYRYALVQLHLSDGFETCEWETIVGFTNASLRWPLFGHAGFLQFFDVWLLGQRREIHFTPNNAFPGRHVVH